MEWNWRWSGDGGVLKGLRRLRNWDGLWGEEGMGKVWWLSRMVASSIVYYDGADVFSVYSNGMVCRISEFCLIREGKEVRSVGWSGVGAAL